MEIQQGWWGTWNGESPLPPPTGLTCWTKLGHSLLSSLYERDREESWRSPYGAWPWIGFSPLPATREEEWKWGETQKPSHALYREVHEKKEWSQLDCHQDWHSHRRTTKRETFA